MSDLEYNDELMRRLLSQLHAGAGASPDLTRSVMQRLGFVACNAATARRARLWASARRVGVAAAVLAAAYGGFWVASQQHEGDDTAIIPAMNTAIQRHGRTLTDVLDGMPRVSQPADAARGAMFLQIRMVPVPARLPQAAPPVVVPRVAARGPFPQA